MDNAKEQRSNKHDEEIWKSNLLQFLQISCHQTYDEELLDGTPDGIEYKDWNNTPGNIYRPHIETNDNERDDRHDAEWQHDFRYLPEII